MSIRFFAAFSLLLFCGACNSEIDKGNSKSESALFENSAISFSDAVSKKNIEKFLGIADKDGVYVVRKFTSGTLGGRGEEFSDRISVSTINDQMEFPIKGQTPLSLKILFPELPIESYQKLPQYKLPAVQESSFDQWGGWLTSALADLPESVDGDPVILTSESYWIYGEAQVIDGVLVGGFAVFKKNTDHFVLVSLIEFL